MFGPVRALGAALTLLALCACEATPPDIAELSGETMGTQFSVKLVPPPDAARAATLQRQIESRLDGINQLMSTYRDDSTLSRFNRSRSTDWQPVALELARLTARANAVSAATDGYYDVTVGPLIELWGFGAGGRRDTPPDAEQIAALRARVGYRHLAVREAPPALRKALPDLAVDLSSIAKGWAVDELARLLDNAGHDSYLIDIGGDIRARGDKGPGRPWRVAIERPVTGAAERLVQRLIDARDIGIATSGDYRNYFAHEGDRFSHTLDPRSGRPVRHRLASVTVFAADCTTADAWATALLALGETAGPQTAERIGIRALFIVRDGERLIETQSSALRDSGLLAAGRGGA